MSRDFRFFTRWTDDEKRRLIELNNLGKYDYTALAAKMPGRTYGACSGMLSRLGVGIRQYANYEYL